MIKKERSVFTDLILGLTKGFLVTVGIIIAILWLASKALAQDSVRTYPASLGEQDRRLVTEQPRYGTPDHVDQYIVSLANEGIEQTVSSQMACKHQNLYLHYLLVDLAKYLARSPHQAELFKPAITGIHDAWCRQ